jgi:hypothetical protein
MAQLIQQHCMMQQSTTPEHSPTVASFAVIDKTPRRGNEHGGKL